MEQEATFCRYFLAVSESAGILEQIDLSRMENSSGRRLMMRNIGKQFSPRSVRYVFT